MAWISIPLHDDSYVGKLSIAASVFLAMGIGSYSLYYLLRRRKIKTSEIEKKSIDNDIKSDGLVVCIHELNQAISNLRYVRLEHQENGSKNDEKSQQLIVCIDRLASQVDQLRQSLENLQEKKDTTTGRRDSIASSQSSDNFFDASVEDDDDDAYNSGIDRFLSCESLESIPNRQSRSDTSINLDELLRYVDQLHRNYDPKSRRKALDKLKSIYGKYQENVQVLWRYARAHLELCEYVDKDEAKTLTYSALDIAKKVLSINDSCSEGHKWYGIALGAIISYEGNKKKIELGFEFKVEMDRAIELNPEDHEVMGYIGRWCYECASLSWYEKKAARLIYGDLPSATISEAREYLIKADGMQPGYSKNTRLYVGKCYLYDKDYRNARHWLLQAKEVATITSQASLNSNYFVTCVNNNR
ncbi:Regulator of microtubule dynamics protein 3 [Trichoplax sp. H2]|nr:Regulator of microtubule dynamics protein 3 [Trichoplax sp. H2]|eukprot:RDD44355.1 Regulator of microtubule dynamics protein 3 [Trichoplax sp. H2]